MKLIFDIDGTLTDFNKYIKNNAIPYFKKHYGMTVKYPNKLEIEDILDMDDFFAKKHRCDLIIAKNYTKKVLDKYWIHLRFIKFSLYPFRSGTREFIKACIKKGNIVEIHSSRAKTNEKGLIGFVSRLFTYLQFVFNGIALPISSFHFYKNDLEKIEGILKSSPNLVVEDKSCICEKTSSHFIKTICVKGWHNTDIKENNYLKKIRNFIEIEDILQW